MTFVRLSALCLSSVLACMLPAAASSEQLGTWTLQKSAGAAVHLTLRAAGQTARTTIGRDFDLSDLGLTRAQLEASDQHLSFSLRREAGTFTFDGIGRGGSADGTYVFAPSAAFVSALLARGIAAPANGVQAAAMLDVTLEYLDGLASAGYAHMPLSEYLGFKALDVTPGFATRMRVMLGTVSADAMMGMRALGVTPEYAQALQREGLRNLSARDLTSLRALHVDSGYVHDMASVGYGNLQTEQLLELRAMRIDAAYVRRLQAHGLKNLSVEQLIRLKAARI